MSNSTVSGRFLVAMREAYRKVLEHGVRSNEKTKVLHGWVQDELRRELGDAYSYTGQSPFSAQEASVAGMYYDKKVDVLVARDGQDLGVVDVKFVISNYWQNAINYIGSRLAKRPTCAGATLCMATCSALPIPYPTKTAPAPSSGRKASESRIFNATRGCAPTMSIFTRLMKWQLALLTLMRTGTP